LAGLRARPDLPRRRADHRDDRHRFRQHYVSSGISILFGNHPGSALDNALNNLNGGNGTDTAQPAACGKLIDR